MGLNIEHPFTRDNSHIDVPDSAAQPGSVMDNPHEPARQKSIQVRPGTLNNVVPATQG